MRITRRRNAIVLSITLGACLVALAIALNVTWVIINWRSLILLVVGIAFFLVLIAGLILNTIFLVREVRRNERHDSFLNAVTHELKTPIASIRLYLETLQRRELPEAQRQEFYDIMLSDSERLLATVEQVLKAGEVGQRARNQVRLPLALDDVVRESRTHHTAALPSGRVDHPPHHRSGGSGTRRPGQPGGSAYRGSQHPRQRG